MTPLEEDYVASLESLGFNGNITVAKAQKKLQEERKTKITVNQNKILYDNIQKYLDYYNMAFPTKNVIPLSTMIKICEKYGLVFGKADLFVQEIPLENLKEIKEFDANAKKSTSKRVFLNPSNLMMYQGESSLDGYSDWGSNDITYHVSAPRSFFLQKSRGLIQTGAYLHIDEGESISKRMNTLKEERRIRKMARSFDPIVWASVKFPLGGGACVLVTKWGKEAEYPDFANPKEN